MSQQWAKAYFAGGCFWCTEALFEKQKGVKEVISGYTGGDVDNPTYEEVSTGRTGHIEAIEVVYDPKVIAYKTLVDLFFKNIDPTQDDGQFHDIGSQYVTAIFVVDDVQKAIALEYKQHLQESGRFQRPIATQILPATRFYPAEEYHQDYYKKKPMHYAMYHENSGREEFKKEHWGSEA